MGFFFKGNTCCLQLIFLRTGGWGRVLGTCSKLDETKREKSKLINELCTRTVNNFNINT